MCTDHVYLFIYKTDNKQKWEKQKKVKIYIALIRFLLFTIIDISLYWN